MEDFSRRDLYLLKDPLGDGGPDDKVETRPVLFYGTWSVILTSKQAVEVLETQEPEEVLSADEAEFRTKQFMLVRDHMVYRYEPTEALGQLFFECFSREACVRTPVHSAVALTSSERRQQVLRRFAASGINALETVAETRGY